MLFEAPPLDDRELGALARIDDLKNQLRFFSAEPRRWQGSLRRLSFARNIRGSNSIEGYDAELDDAAAVALGEEPLDADTETRLALSGYRNAMTYVLQLAQEQDTAVSIDLVRSLHFMMTQYDLKNRPGRWRAGSIYVRDENTGNIVHEGVDISEVHSLMKELVISTADNGQGLVRASMAHLNLVMIHPFRDGNGRMARCLQSLVLATDGTLSPIFMSVEEYLGRNTQDYYDVLAEVGGGHWQPHRDARPWIRFMLTAHLRQALTTQRRFRESERLWDQLERLIAAQGAPERSIVALWDAAVGLRVRNATYRASLQDQQGEEITEATASRDLRALVNNDLLVPSGEKRGRHYIRSPRVREVYEKIVAARDPLDMTNPFD